MNRRKRLADYAIILNDKDNVATALVDLAAAGYVLDFGDSEVLITVTETVKAGFKLALSDIRKGESIYKYGYVIGLATEDIKKGDCVHVHNLISAI